MRFAVRGAEPIIHDPDTSEELDILDPEKVRVQTTVVREQVTICETYYSRLVRERAGLFSSYLDWADEFSQVKRREDRTSPQGDSTGQTSVDQNDSYVKPGDRAVQVIESDEASDLN